MTRKPTQKDLDRAVERAAEERERLRRVMEDIVRGLPMRQQQSNEAN